MISKGLKLRAIPCGVMRTGRVASRLSKRSQLKEKTDRVGLLSGIDAIKKSPDRNTLKIKWKRLLPGFLDWKVDVQSCSDAATL